MTRQNIRSGQAADREACGAADLGHLARPRVTRETRPRSAASSAPSSFGIHADRLLRYARGVRGDVPRARVFRAWGFFVLEQTEREETWRSRSSRRTGRRRARRPAQQVVAKCKTEGIESMLLWFTDLEGHLKSFAITPDELEGALDDGMGFDGSSITGFNAIEESDMVAIPDPDTFVVMPWRSGESKVGRMICDVVTPDGKPYEGDPRYVLRRRSTG